MKLLSIEKKSGFSISSVGTDCRLQPHNWDYFITSSMWSGHLVQIFHFH